MDKDDNLFEDGIKESSDLLDIGLDDLQGDAKGEEDDEGIIDLIDLVEKGDAELFGDDDIVKEDVHIPDEDIDSRTEEKDELDELLLDADMTTPADDSGINPLEDLSADLLSVDNLPDDSDNAPSEEDITGDMFKKLLDDTVLDELSEDADELPEDTEEFNLEPEDFPDLESMLEEEPFHDEKIAESTAPAGIQGNLFRDFEPLASAPEETHGLDDELISDPDIFGDELEKTIVSSDDVTNDKSFWGTGAESNTLNAEAEAEGISILEEASSDDEKIEYSGMDTEDEDYVNIDDIQLDSKSLESLFPDEVKDESVPDVSLQDDNKELISSDSLDIDQPEIIIPEEHVISQSPVTDEIKPAEESAAVSAETIVQPAISEERIEEIVTKVVSEVVERVAREVFKEVAEKVISEAIEGLKKSLEAELE